VAVATVAGLIALVVCRPTPASAQQADRLRVFLDCPSCDSDYVLTTQTTGPGGREYTLFFLGRGTYAEKSDTMRYVASPDDTDDIRRQGLVRVMKMGLVRYIADSPLGERIRVTIAAPAEGAAAQPSTPARDPWNYWVFSASGNGYLSGESLQQFSDLFLTLSANRTTDQWKVRLSASDSYSESSFEVDDTTTVTSIRRSYSGGLLVAKSISSKLSAGFQAVLESSTFGNVELSWRLAPAIEYNLFPYSESTRRSFTALYTAGVNSFDYKDLTIYGKLDEARPSHRLIMEYTTRQPWGSTGVEVSASQFLHDTSKYRWAASLNGSVRLFKGLSLNGGATYSRVRDQLAVPAGDATQQEILLRQRLLRTNYFYYANFGLSYRFGSIFSTVVNTRFNNLGSGSIIG
jgi:hypothetical protein